jgi:F-type H+-transporting ATPase subunit delta
MPNPRLAARYAKSIIDLALESNQLTAVYADMRYLHELTKVSKEFTGLLRSPIIKGDKKGAAIKAVVSGNVSELTSAFINLLINKGREGDLPEIVSAFVDQYNKMNGITRVSLTTAVPVDEGVRNAITERLQKDANLQSVQLETSVDESLIGGFKLEFNNNLVDASVRHDLNFIRKQFNENLFIQSIR